MCMRYSCILDWNPQTDRTKASSQHPTKEKHATTLRTKEKSQAPRSRRFAFNSCTKMLRSSLFNFLGKEGDAHFCKTSRVRKSKLALTLVMNLKFHHGHLPFTRSVLSYENLIIVLAKRWVRYFLRFGTEAEGAAVFQKRRKRTRK